MVSGAQEMARSAYPKLILEMALVRLAQLEPLTGLDLLVDRLSALEAEFDGEPAPPVRASTPMARPAAAPVPRTVDTPAAAPTAHQPVVSRPEVSRAPASPTLPQEEGDDSDAEEDPVVEQPAQRPVTAPVDDPVVPDRPAPPLLDEPDADFDVSFEPAAPEASEPEASEPEVSEPEDSETEPVVAPARVPQPQEPAAERGEAPDLGVEFNDEDEHAVASVDIKRLHPSELASMSATARRNRLVEEVRRVSKAIAAVLDNAYVESFENNRIELSLSDRLLALLADNNRTERLQEVARRLLGDAWVVDLQTRDPVNGVQGTTIVEERDAERRARRQELEKELRDSIAVTQAREVFNVPDEKIRVQVRLFDDF
jgi:hypothetical protein